VSDLQKWRPSKLLGFKPKLLYLAFKSQLDMATPPPMWAGTIPDVLLANDFISMSLLGFGVITIAG
jgi:hypothetical protein